MTQRPPRRGLRPCRGAGESMTVPLDCGLRTRGRRGKSSRSSRPNRDSVHAADGSRRTGRPLSCRRGWQVKLWSLCHSEIQSNLLKL